MIQVFVEDMRGCKVINIDVDDITEIKTGSIIELDETAWGGRVVKYLVTHVNTKEKIVTVTFYNKRILHATPTSNDKLYD